MLSRCRPVVNRSKRDNYVNKLQPTQLPTRRRSSSDPDPTFTERSFVFPKFRVYVSRIKRLCQL